MSSGAHKPDLTDHHESIRVLWPACERCGLRYRRDLGHRCLLGPTPRGEEGAG